MPKRKDITTYNAFRMVYPILSTCSVKPLTGVDVTFVEIEESKKKSSEFIKRIMK